MKLGIYYNPETLEMIEVINPLSNMKGWLGFIEKDQVIYRYKNELKYLYFLEDFKYLGKV